MSRTYTYPAGSEITWSAQWIGTQPAGVAATPNQWIAYRATLDLPASASTSSAATAPVAVPCHIGVDSKYWLWINGELAIFEGGVKRGPSPDDTYFDTIDLGPWLHAGANTVAVLVWYWGKSGFCHQDSGRAGLVLQAELPGGGTFLSSAAWRCRVHPAHGLTGGEQPNRRLPEANIGFDARLDIPGWQAPGFDDSAWPAAVAYGVPPVAPWNRLVRRDIPQWTDSGLVDYVGIELPAVGEAGVAVGHLPYNCHVTPWLEIDAPAGLTIDIRTDNYVGGSENNVRTEYITRAGRQSFESLGWMNGHAIHYTLPAGVTVLALKYRETGYGTAFTGPFACDDPFLNRLHEKALRTLYITMRDSYMDCPDRERAQWWGDVVNEMGEAFYALDTRSHALVRKGMYELINWQKDDGGLFAPIPTNKSCGELPLQMLASVGRYGFWTYYHYTGDRQVMADLYAGVAEYLGLWQIDPATHLVVPRKGEWNWGDWGVNIDMEVLNSVWYCIALQGQARMARLLGRDAEAATLDATERAMAAAVNRHYWNGTAYRGTAYTGATDDRSNALAVVAGIAGASRFAAIRTVLATEYHASPYMEKYVLEALYQMRYADDALARMRKRFRAMVDSPLTTLWEGWGIGKEGFGGGTINHAWSGGPLTVLNQYAAGIAPRTPGWTHYEVLPQMGRLRRIATTVPTVLGDIEVQLERDGERFRMIVDSPAGTVAHLGIPRECCGPAARLRVAGVSVALDGMVASTLSLPTGMTWEGVTADYVCVRVLPGRWTLDVSR